MAPESTTKEVGGGKTVEVESNFGLELAKLLVLLPRSHVPGLPS